MDDKNLKTNADGDVDLQASSLNIKEVLQYNTFRYPPCPYCLEKYADSDMLQVDSDGAWKGGTAGIIKPAVIFFGENVSHEIRDHVNEIIEMSDQLLIMGTTLAVLSAQRLVRLAKSQGKRIAVMTSGYVRNEEMLVQDGDLRIWWRSSDVLKHLSYLSGLK
jgi:NAD+-dependent protein deacetylase sirtuin 4